MSPNVESRDEFPLSIEPAVGWRVWQLIRLDDGDLRLTAVAHATVWPPLGSTPATCARAAHAAPQADCTCGYYTSSSVQDLAAAGIFVRGIAVIGTVSVWGTVVEHSRGARSRYAYPSRLRLVCSPCLQLGWIVDPVIVAGGASLTPLCDRHRPSRGEDQPAPAVQAALLSTYGVDLLPMPSVNTFGRRPGDIRPQRVRFRSWAGTVAGIWFLVRVLSGIGVSEDAVAGAASPPPVASSSALRADTPRVVEPHPGGPAPAALRFEVGPTSGEHHPVSVAGRRED
jgi:hypothetical protein